MLVPRRKHLANVLLVMLLPSLIYFSYQLFTTKSVVTHTILSSFYGNDIDFVGTMKRYAKHIPKSDSSDQDMNFIILAMTDKPFFDMALNLYLSSFKRFGIENFLFVGAGRNACQALNELNIQCYDFWNDPDADKSNSYGTKAFIRKMNIRTEMILEALKNNISVLHTDLDVVFLRNPMDELEKLLATNNMAILWDHVTYNAGFLAIKATHFSNKVYEEVRLRTNRSATLDDQKALNGAINFYTAKDPLQLKSIKVLDKKRYLSGKDYFENNRNFPPKQDTDNCPGCMVVHNNWIVSLAAKIYRFKESTLWWVDNGRYYSDDKRKYFLYYNPFINNPPANFNVEKSEIEALKSGLAMAEMLNRTLIIPRFHCHRNAQECPLNSWFRIANFDKEFSTNYRESSFLLNQFVPQAISMRSTSKCLLNNDYGDKASSASSTSNTDKTTPNPECHFRPTTILLVTKNNTDLVESVLEKFPLSKIVNSSNSESLDETFILSNFGDSIDQVLAFSSLLGVQVSFNDKIKEKSFKNKLTHGLTRAGYIQL